MTNNNDRDAMLMQWAAQTVLADSVALIEDFEFDGEPRLVLAAPDIAEELNAKRLVTMQSLALDTRTAAAILRENWLRRIERLAATMAQAIQETWGVTPAEFIQARKDYDALRADERRRAREADLQAGDYGDSAYAAEFGAASGGARMTGLYEGDGERAHAERCARTIADYWLARGERVTVKAVGLSKINSAGGRVTAIRSDLRAGLPTRTGVVFTPAERRGPR